MPDTPDPSHRQLRPALCLLAAFFASAAAYAHERPTDMDTTKAPPVPPVIPNLEFPGCGLNGPCPR